MNMTRRLGLIIHGARGRMGRIVTELACREDNLDILALIERKGHPDVGKKDRESGLEVTDRWPERAGRNAVVIDFSTSSALLSLLKRIRPLGLALVSGTTGLGEKHLAMLRSYAERRPVFYDANMSPGVAILRRLVSYLRCYVGTLYDAEIVEFHHRGKRDHPSGTALCLASELVDRSSVVAGRGKRKAREGSMVHIHSVRAGGIRGRHDVILVSDDEMLTLSHAALSRAVFGKGALMAARFVSGKRRGLFDMKDLTTASDEVL